MSRQTTLPENLSEQATRSGVHLLPTSCYYHVSESHSGSPLIPPGHNWFTWQQAVAKQKRITIDAASKLTHMLLTSKEPGVVMTIHHKALQEIYGHNDFYTDKSKAARAAHLKQVRRGYKYPYQKSHTSQYEATPLIINSVFAEIDHRLIGMIEQADPHPLDQLIATNRTIRLARNVSRPLTKREQHIFDVVYYVVLPITLDEINRLIELERYCFRKPMYRSILDQCIITGQQLTLKMVYNEDAYGRLHCKTLTGIRVPVRDAISKGFYQYDIKSCAPTILIEMYKQIQRKRSINPI